MSTNRSHAETTATQLTNAQRLHLEELLKGRTAIAKTFTISALVLTSIGVIRLMAGAPRGDTLLAILGSVGIASLAAVVVYFAGWVRVLRMRRDLDAGLIATHSGVVEKLSSTPNAYGETITTLHLNNIAHTTRDTFFAELKCGDTITVTYMPESKVPLSATRAQKAD